MTDAARYQEIAARLEAATPGPWRIGTQIRRCLRDHGRGPGGHGRGDCVYEPVGWHDDPHDISTEDGALIVGNYDYEEGGVVYPRDTPLIANAPADLRWALDRIRALEEAVHISWRVYDRFGHWQCGHCGMDELEERHAPSCIVLTLPAPEAVETQG